jgi:ankyrin repeat protein
MINDSLFEAIEDRDIDEISNLLKRGVDPNVNLTSMEKMGFNYTPLVAAIDEMTYGGSIDAVHLLIKYGAKINPCDIDGTQTPISVAVNNGDAVLVKLLLSLGGNPNIMDEEHSLPLLNSVNNHEIANLLLTHGARSRLNDIGNKLCGCTTLGKASEILDYKTIVTLLDNGADTSAKNENSDIARWHMPKKNSLNRDLWIQVYDILDPENPPYLKLGSANNGKHIIYEKKDGVIYLLGEIDRNKNKKYLYYNFEPGFFLIWSAKNNLLYDALKTAIFSMIEKLGYPSCHETFKGLMKNIIGTTLTTDYFTEDGKAFAIGYLTVTNWWYNLHYDLTKLFPVENGFAQVPETDKAYSIIEKLLDKRYEQFRSGKHFNSNQKPEELRSLLEDV